MLKKEEKQFSFYSSLYEKIPETHLLKRIEKAVDFSFINELVAGSYCEDFGRPAKEPELMAKLLFLEYLYNLSDVRVIEEATYNLVFLWFLGLNPDDKLPSASLLAKFRTLRLKECTLDEIISEIVRQCVETGIIKSKEVSIDATHVGANCVKLVPERIMKHLAIRIFKALKKDLGEIPETVDRHIPDYQSIEDHKKAKAMMKAYLEKVMNEAAAYAGEHTKAAIEEAMDVLADERFIIQKGLRSLSDPDARVGHKSPTDTFFGYKTEYAMTPEERIITAVDVHDGEYVDGKEAGRLIEKTEAAGVEVKTVYGDKAYFRKDILDMLEDKQIEGVIPVSASVYKVDEELFSYCKDSDQWFCFMGNHTVGCKKGIQGNGRGDTYEIYTYVFKKDPCEACPYRDRCIGKTKGKAKKLRVTASAPIFYAISQEQKKPEFKEKYKKRASIEWKNAEMKHLHGMARARGWGKRSVTFQIKLTAIAVNLKRIAAIVVKQEAETGCNVHSSAPVPFHVIGLLSVFSKKVLKQGRFVAA